MTVKYCASCAGCVRIFGKPLLYIIYYLLGRNLEIKQKIESAVVKTIESVPEKVLKPEHIETRNQKWEGQTYPGTDVSYRKKRICTGWKIKGRRLPEI